MSFRRFQVVVVLAAGLSLAVPGAAWAEEPGDGPGLSKDWQEPRDWVRQEPPRPGFREALRLLQRRKAALTAHQVLATASFVSILTSSSLGTARLAWADQGGSEAELFPLEVAERSAAFVALGTYSPAGILAWAAPSPTAHITGKGLSKSNTTRDRHMLWSILHGVFYGVFYTTGIVSLVGVDPEAKLAVDILHTAAGYAATVFIGIAAVTVQL